ASLNRPGGNVTGVTFTTTELMAKRLDLLRELVPQAATVAYLADTRSVVGQEMLSEILVAAGVLGRQLAVAECVANTNSRRPLRLSSNAGPARWLSVRLYFLTAIATSWWRWQHATSCRRFTRRANTLWRAA